MELIIAEYAGFCFGVERAINIAQQTARKSTKPVGVLKGIVHNKHVVEQLKEKNVGTIDDINPNNIVIISAHGATVQTYQLLQQKKIEYVDTTCPLVTKIHKLIRHLAKNNYKIFLLGDKNHDEVLGEYSQAPDSIYIIKDESDIDNLNSNLDFSSPLALVSQSTASLSQFEKISKYLKNKFPDVEIYNTICQPVTLRQNSVIELAKKVDVVIVIGSPTSANSKRLQEVSSEIQPKSYLVDSPQDLNPLWFKNIKRVGITAGTSTPDWLIKKVIEKIKEIKNATTDNPLTGSGGQESGRNTL